MVALYLASVIHYFPLEKETYLLCEFGREVTPRLTRLSSPLDVRTMDLRMVQAIRPVKGRLPMSCRRVSLGVLVTD